jgi:hypothetical protein
VKLETYSGGYLDYDQPTADQIDVVDIARALSQMCRFNGHTERFYSVAEHALLCESLVPGLGTLHHDSHEAYLGDIPTPLKQHLIGWKGLTKRIDQAVADAFGFPVSTMTEADVKWADRMALRIEAYELKASGGLGEYWGNTEPPTWSPPWPLGLTPDTAEAQFLARHRQLLEGR